MSKVWKNKFVIILLLIIVFFFFGSITNTLVLNNRGIVVGMGLDCLPTGEIKVSCQVLVAGDIGADNANNDNYAILSAKGATFGDATQQMMIDSAEFMSYAHCNSIIVSRGMVESGRLFDVLDELLKNSKITENTNLVYFEGDPKDMLKQKVGINLMASFAIERMMGASKEYADIVKCTIRDYLVATTNKKGVCVIPEVVVEEKIDEPTQGNEQKGEDKVILSARGGVCVSKEDFLGKLSIEEVGYYNIVKKDFSKGVFAVQTSDGERSVEFFQKKADFGYDEQNLIASCKISAEFKESNLISDWEGRGEKEKKDIEQRMAQNIEKGVYSLFDRFYALGYDLYGVKRGFYQNFGKKIKEKLDGGEKINLKISVKCILNT